MGKQAYKIVYHMINGEIVSAEPKDGELFEESEVKDIAFSLDKPESLFFVESNEVTAFLPADRICFMEVFWVSG